MYFLYLCIDLSIYRSIYLCIYISIYLNIYLNNLQGHTTQSFLGVFVEHPEVHLYFQHSLLWVL